jgi:DNA-binding transcriptional MocR family regulator
MAKQTVHSARALDSTLRFEINGSTTLVEQIAHWFGSRIEQGVFRAGSRLPSIRQFAVEAGVSRFTVVDAYDRLIAQGQAESRRGSGFFVRHKSADISLKKARAWAESPNPNIDVVWLLRNMFRQLPSGDAPGGGVLPAQWLDAQLVTASLRSIGRQSGAAFLEYGHPQGYLPLRQQLQKKLSGLEIAVASENIVTTCGVTQGLDLVTQTLLKPGDCAIVDDPSWFLLFGRLERLGVKVIGVPRLADGPDISVLQNLVQLHKPRMYFTTSVLHNPSSGNLSPAKAFQILRLAEEKSFYVVEDDVYCDLYHDQARPVTRLASLDQLKRVIYLGGFSKTLAPNLRVGFIACDVEIARAVTDTKMLVGLTSSELGERLVYKILSEGHYRHHLERVRGKLNEVREPTIRALEKLGLNAPNNPSVGMFIWMQGQCSSTSVARNMLDQGYLLAPGSLFHPDQRESPFFRFNLTSSSKPAMLSALAQALERS